MRSNHLKATLKTAVLVTLVLLLGAGLALAQQQVNLTAGPSTVTLPDGSTVPMWGYTCGAAVTSSTATCAALNPTATGWSPVVITVPAGQSLTINLTNNLPIPPGATLGIPTSLTIVGQLGGGLGTTATSTLSPDHTGAQANVTWPIAAPGGGAGSPPVQANRVQSFSTEVQTGATTPTALTWTTPRPGTYLLESGTHPSIQGPMGLYGIVVVTSAPGSTAPGATTSAGCAYGGATGTTTTCAVPYNAEIPLLLSEIDPVQNRTVNAAVNTASFSETMVWSGLPGGCGNPASATYLQCYPPAVNYRPLYYLINGVAFDKTQTAASPSLFAATAGVTTATPPAPVTTGISGTVLVRMVNAGLRMHIPSIVGALTTPPIFTTGTTPVAVAGLSLIAEDGNPLPGVSRVQSEVFMPAGKTYDVMINVPAAGGTALPVFDRELSLSANATARDAGMLAYIGVNGAGLPTTGAFVAAVVARDDTYNSVITGKTLTVSDPGKGLIANDTNVFGVQLVGTVAGLTLNPDGTFTYTGAPTSFTYCANGTVTGTTCSSGHTATVTLGAASMEAAGGITVNPDAYTSNVATSFSIKPPGILANDTDGAGYPLTVNGATPSAPLSLALAGPGTGTVTVDPNGGFNATVSAPGIYTFSYAAQNSQGTVGTGTATVTLTFLAGSGVQVTVVDGRDKTTPVTDYRWVIEEDRTFYVNPYCTTNPPAAGCPTATSGLVPTFGTNFHTSYMPVIATGCTGPLSCESGQQVGGVAAVCDIGNGVCRTTAAQETALDPSQVHLDPTKRYYISVLPGDAANSFENVNGCLGDATPDCGHGMGGAPIACALATGEVACSSTDSFPAVTLLVQPNPFPPSKLSVFVFEDDFPLNGEQDGGGGIDVLSPNEPGLGGFNITLFDDAGGTGDATGQMTYDMFNQPLSNSLAGTIDPNTGLDACPLSAAELVGVDSSNGNLYGSASPTGITGTIVTCPTYESDRLTLSPLAGQAVVANLMPGRYGVVATPAADRIGRGEEWLQTNTLDGQKAHDSFLRIGEPSFFQEFGPAGYHVSIGFANPKIINDRLAGVCAGADPNISGSNCHNTLTGQVTNEHLSRTPDERLYSSGDYTHFGFTQCYVSFGDPDGEDFAFTKCNADGTFTLSGLPDGSWRVTVFDQWNDMLVDGLSTPIGLSGGSSGATTNMGQIATSQWQADIYTSTFFDQNGDGVRQDTEPGLPLVSTNIRFRDGSYSNFNNTDLSGNAGFNEVFPLFSWYVVETDSTRYKTMGAHVVYDAGGPVDNTPCGTAVTPPTAPCGNSTIAANLANTVEQVPLPAALRIPGARYCAAADCPAGDTTGGSTGRVDPPMVHPYGSTYGWQGFSGQNSFIEFSKKPYVVGETGGIHGEVTYASTRPFDDPSLLLHTSWTPNVPGVTINLYQEGTAPDGSTSLKLVDTTTTSSFDNWAQGFHLAADGVTQIPNMNCPGQGRDTGTAADIFFYTLFNQPMWLDVYNNGVTSTTPLPNNSQFKCYDGMHNWNQVQPAPYDGMYQFPSVTRLDPTTGKPAGTNCTACVSNPDTSDTFRFGTPMLPAGKYVVEMIVPPGYELVKEEDKNILIGDNYIAPVTQEFGGLGNIFILPDQAEVSSLYNANNPNNATQTLGRTTFPSSEGDTGSVEVFWPCVGASRTIPDFISLFPQSAEVSPFAGATRNLCDRKEVTLTDQTSVLAKFWVFTSAHVAAHYTGVITDDYTSEFDPFSPQFGEKFSPPDLPVSIKDWSGTEISRTYADQWGTYDGLTYSTWEVNPPNPTGYAPTMMVTCMNDPGPIPGPGGTQITDPLFTAGYSQFCYEIPFMPGQTQYMDTPVVPTSAFAGAGYNNVDCAYPANTPAVAEVDGDGIGPWVSAAGHTIRITALGDQTVPNYAYAGPAAVGAPYNQKTITRHYGFGPAPAGGCSNGVPTAACPNVKVGGIPLHGVTWSDTTITGTVQANVPVCAIQQQALYGGSSARCGQLVITATNGQQSIDAVTVTIGGKAPTHVLASGSIQSAIDAAAPGDLIIVDPTCTTASGPAACNSTGITGKTAAAHDELLLMWKPVRLQGVGAATTIINATTHPAGKLDVWRRQVNCLFGLTLNGAPISGTNPYDPTGAFSCPAAGWNYYHPTANNPQIDRLPLEATVGWDASLNGNLAELLQEPSLMGALEGAGITVLSKGVFFPTSPFDPTLFAGFPTGTVLFTSSNRSTYCDGNYPSNFWCNPASIDGLGITESSQGGGGVFVHGWGHNLQIANNRILDNSGTLSGGINVGQGEFPGAYIQGSATNAPPGSCETSTVTNFQLPYCHNLNVNVHNNDVSLNSSTGDELFSATPAGAGGVSFCTGSDYYQFNYNWVCGNLSSGDGGGIGHLGFSKNGDIEHNTIVFNQSTNPTIPTNGGGIIIMGTPDVDPTCGTTTDQDCVPTLGSVGPSDGVGPGLTINANLIMGNAAESGSGGGIAFQNVNGADVVSFPTTPANWHHITVTNNIIVDNVAGWDGAGVSLLDALNLDLVNNTIASNSTTASAGMLFTTIGAPLASTQGTNCTLNGATASCPQPAGLVSQHNSAVLGANLPTTITCPANHFTGSASNGSCRNISSPLMTNNVFWQNSAYYIGVGALGGGTLNQQNIVSLYNAGTSTLAPNQPQTYATTAHGSGLTITGGTGACAAATYWDIGVRGDTGPGNHASTFQLAPTYSVLTNASENALGSNNFLGANPNFASQYCDGSRTPPEFGASGWAVPPGISDATVPNPIFNLTPTATVDEGNNWINMRWGPLSLVNPVTSTATSNVVLGNYVLTTGSPAIDVIPSSVTHPSTDFFGNPRPDPANSGCFDVGAAEFAGTSTNQCVAPPTLTSISPNTGQRGKTVTVTLTGTNLTGTSAVNVSGTGIIVGAITVVSPTTVTASFSISATATRSIRTVSVTTPGGTSNTVSFTVNAGTLAFTSATNGTLSTVVGVRTLTFTIPSPRAAVTSVVTMRNTSTTVPLQITAETLTVNIGGLYSVTGSTCSFTTPLAPSGTCTVSIRYATPATQPTLPDIGAFTAANNGTTAGLLALSAR